jgi:AraC-like DNA-binding protein
MKKGQSFVAFRRNDPEFAFNWHFHPELELTYIIRSRGVRMVGDNVENYRAGDLVLLGPNLPHTWASEENSGASHQAIVIQFRAEIFPTQNLPEMEGVKAILGMAARGIHFSGPNVFRAARGMRRILRLRGLKALTELLSILDLLAGGGALRPLAARHYLPLLNQKQKSRFERVLRFLEQNALRGEASLGAAARAASMAPAAFSRFFRRMAGKPYIQFLNEMRLTHACRLLMDTERPITEVAFESGFGNLSNFNRSFLASKGTTPSGYRRLHEPPASG